VKRIERKLGKLENCVLDKSQIDLKTTQIAYECLSEAERKLMDQSHEIIESYSVGDKLTKAQRTVIDKANSILAARINWLFLTHLQSIFCGDDYHATITLNERLLWFYQEIRKEMKQQHEVAEIEKNTPEDCEVDRVDEYFQKAPDCFTEKSWYELQDKLTHDWVKHMKKTGKWKPFLKKWGPQKMMAEELMHACIKRIKVTKSHQS